MSVNGYHPASLVPASGKLREWVELYGPTTEAPDEAHLAIALATISAAVGWKAHIRWADHSEPCTLNVILTGKSATARKTTVASTAASLVRTALATTPAELAGLRVRQMSHASDAGIYELVSPKDAYQARAWEDDPPPGTLLIWDEIGSMMGRPQDGKGNDYLGRLRVAVMSVTNGRHGGIQTRTLKVEPGRCAVAIVGTMTRAELEERISLGLLREGFLGRFLLIGADVATRPRYLAFPPPETAEWRRRRDELAKWIHDLAQTRDDMGNAFDHFTPEAKAARQAWYESTARTLEARANTGDENAVALLEVFGRVQTAAAKAAVVAAVAEWAPPQSLTTTPIKVEHVRYGIEVAHGVLREVRRLETDSAPDADESRYRDRVLAYLAKNARDRITKKKLLDDNKSGRLPRDRCWRIVEQLHSESEVVLDVDSSTPRQAIIVSLP